jgi:hypothetical protein
VMKRYPDRQSSMYFVNTIDASACAPLCFGKVEKMAIPDPHYYDHEKCKSTQPQV